MEATLIATPVEMCPEAANPPPGPQDKLRVGAPITS